MDTLDSKVPFVSRAEQRRQQQEEGDRIIRQAVEAGLDAEMISPDGTQWHIRGPAGHLHLYTRTGVILVNGRRSSQNGIDAAFRLLGMPPPPWI